MLSTRLHILSLLLLVSTFAFAQTIRYVTPVGKNTNPATAVSWAASTTDLQGAINASQAGDQVWVAGGTYKPGGNANTNRSVSFSMKNDVAIYGGFTGNETALNQRPATDPVNGQPSSSTLSGEIGDPNSTTDNSYHVISNSGGLTITAVLDGFVITGGNANGDFPDNWGGGAFNNGSGSANLCSPVFRKCAFLSNSAQFGGAMFNYGASGGNCNTTLINCFFLKNLATLYGGALLNSGPNGTCIPVIINCFFLENVALTGGAISNSGAPNGICSPVLTNCTFLNNLSNNTGGAMINDGTRGTCRPVLTNCSFLKNSAANAGSMMINFGNSGICNPVMANCVIFDTPGSNAFFNSSATITATYSLFEPSAVSGVSGLDLSGPGNLTNITTSPFVSTTSAALAPNSPAINAGDPSTSSATVGMTDLAGNPRFVGRIDMGALEFQGILEIYTLKNGNWNDPSVWSLSRMPQPGERARLRHTVTIPAGFTASGLILSYDPDGRLIHEAGGRLQLGN